MSACKVLVVDDSVFMRIIISDLIAEDSRYEVIGTAKNGKEAIAMTHEMNPDVITMDIEMPEMNGLDALRTIMSERPTPVIMLSSLTAEGTLGTVRALEWGAVDFLQKPSGAVSFDLFKVKQQLFDKLALALQTKVRPIVSFAAQAPKSRESHEGAAASSDKLAAARAGFTHIVAIGTSTGGPRALHQVLAALPAAFPAPVLIVQHMLPSFTKSLADRLDAASRISVEEAADGMLLASGKAYVAPGGFHMKVVSEGGCYRIRLTEEAPQGGHRPSVDCLFESLVPLSELKRHIVLMTGMGSDGAKGMLALKRSGAVTTIAESEETCIVYGMPRAAVELGAAMNILPQQKIAARLVEAIV